MFAPGSQAHIWLCTQPTDMRKSFDGLFALVKNQLGHNPLNGHYFVFVNRRRTQMKVLYFEPSGFCLWSKRLEQGQFRVKPSPAGQLSLSWTELQLILDGIEIHKSRQFKRYHHST